MWIRGKCSTEVVLGFLLFVLLGIVPWVTSERQKEFWKYYLWKFFNCLSTALMATENVLSVDDQVCILSIAQSANCLITGKQSTCRMCQAFPLYALYRFIWFCLREEPIFKLKQVRHVVSTRCICSKQTYCFPVIFSSCKGNVLNCVPGNDYTIILFILSPF